jgi:hypothetical protein
MSPQEISALASLIEMVNRISGWPFGLMLFLFLIGPWILSLLIAYLQRSRFEAVVNMYEKNVSLVEKYEKVASDLKDVIILHTQTTTTMINDIRTNQYCPMIRLRKTAAGHQEEPL